jgi:hypothetical protein
MKIRMTFPLLPSSMRFSLKLLLVIYTRISVLSICQDCNLESYEIKSNATESFGDENKKLHKMNVDVDFTGFSKDYQSPDCLRLSVESKDSINNLKVSKEGKLVSSFYQNISKSSSNF